MSQFIAIPVGAGDSFFLERNGRTILVDGGRAEHGFPTLLRERHHVKMLMSSSALITTPITPKVSLDF